MEIMDKGSNRPGTVKLATFILACGWIIGAVKGGAGSPHLDNPMTWVVLAIFLGLGLLLAWLIWQGKNWARWLCVILLGLGVLSAPSVIHRLLERSKFNAIFYCFQFALQVAYVVLLFLPSSNKWFSATKNMKSSSLPPPLPR